MERSESIKELATALCKFQKEVGKISKGTFNKFFKTNYANLSDILDVVQKPLSECGLCVIQLPDGNNELKTIIMHISGEYILSSYVMVPTDTKPQTIGSCITYQRRYALCAALNLNVDDDDDGNAANGNEKKTKEQKEAEHEELAQKLNKDRLIPLDKRGITNTLVARLYKTEKEDNDRGLDFNLRDFVSRYYKFDESTFIELEKQYANYITAVKSTVGN